MQAASKRATTEGQINLQNAFFKDIFSKFMFPSLPLSLYKISPLSKDDEREAGRMEGHREGLEEGIALIEAMLADHKEADIPRTKKDPIFRMEMMEYYHIIEPQKQI